MLGTVGVRKACVAKGDDGTFSRWIKDHAEASKRRPRQIWLPAMRHKALEEARTIFRKSLRQPDEVKSLLVSGHSNVKLGRDVRDGRMFRGWWLYSLSLEERATCPRTCHHWDSCYGNNMPFAKRIDTSDEAAFMAKLEADLEAVLAVRGRAGVLVRLHVLGDFFSSAYVRFWGDMLAKHDRLAVFGYTARKRASNIGAMIQHIKDLHPDRFRIRWSDGGEPKDCTVSIAYPEDKPANAFICPEQTGKRDACGKCGACWNSETNVAFVNHGVAI
jgi:hypothetical protein